jgi:hypothetical protein
VKNNKFNIIISEEATNMLEDHINFLLQVSISGANKLFLEITEAIQSISEFPQRNPWFNKHSIC